jgi:hypothetical protein
MLLLLNILLGDVHDELVDSVGQDVAGLLIRGMTQKRLVMVFRVSWKGVSTKDDTWKPFVVVHETQAFIGYFLSRRMSSLFPKQHKA